MRKPERTVIDYAAEGYLHLMIGGLAAGSSAAAIDGTRLTNKWHQLNSSQSLATTVHTAIEHPLAATEAFGPVALFTVAVLAGTKRFLRDIA
jgi:hypothetical protein